MVDITHLSEWTREAILRLAEARGMTPEQVIDEAISLEVAVDNARSDGARVLLEKHGHVQELVPA